MKFLLMILSFLFFANLLISQDLLMLKTSGKVVIGDTSQISTPGPYNLYVQNGVMTEKVKVAVKTASDWSDLSFENTPSLEQVKKSIETNSHLYNMPSADSLVSQGYDIQKMDAKIVEQIEWLWQHTLKISAENKALREELELLKAKKDEK